ncbi:purine/pyrimidine permease [Arthrobacter zhangbolii]|uniref:Purine/pyrimidine permease n=1 Tax=Arthrobacter zhangbolii TaxID=2886936 RepID=A0A9X1M8Q0_9MICC|nr:nucleobase:cation symporter-2 family protein [Arthrobacter zhangbolii]MCC3272587.1 purine/pyrimidine permease [Arthrobacter zhangbolii]UON91565.1 purine/pyrimidine permease [Arthrobacter zhangbolii]
MSAALTGVDEKLPPAKLVLAGAQHLLAMYASIAAAPLVLAVALQLPQEQVIYLLAVTALASGVATILQSVGIWNIGARLPIVQGTTFTAVAPMILIGGEWGLPAIFGSVIAAGLFTFIAAPFFSRVLFLFPPVVTGTTIAAIGISLIPIAANWMVGGDQSVTAISGLNLLLAVSTLVIILAVSRIFSGFLGRIAVLVGLVLGTLIAIPFGLVDFSGVGTASVFEFPAPFAFGLPTFHFSAVLAMIIVMLITMVETTSDALAIGDITGEKVDEKRVAATLRADGLSTMLGGVFNSFPFTAYAQNVGLIRLSGVKSRWAITAAGVLLVLMGLFPQISAVVAAIPMPVLGGAAMVLFGGVAAVGIGILGRVNLNDSRNILIVSVSLGLAMVPVSKPGIFSGFPASLQIVVENSIVLACLSAIVLNLIFNVAGRMKDGQGGDAPDTGTAPAEGPVLSTGTMPAPTSVQPVGESAQPVGTSVQSVGELVQPAGTSVQPVGQQAGGPAQPLGRPAQPAAQPARSVGEPA